MSAALTLSTLGGNYAVSKLGASAPLPDWADGSGLVNVVRADEELSIVCLSERVPDGVEKDDGWCAIKVDTKFGFDEPGVVLSVVRPISEAGLGIFVMSTFLRDYILVRSEQLNNARQLLVAAGHSFA